MAQFFYDLQMQNSLQKVWSRSPVVLHRLIHKIPVGEVKKIDGQKVQEVKIVYNFVGEVAIALEWLWTKFK